MTRFWIAPVAIAAIFAAGCSTKAEVAKSPVFGATLHASAGVTTTGKGSATFTLEPTTRALTYSVAFEGLTGPALMAHIHGPADPGDNAGVVVPLTGTESPLTGTATLTEEQVTLLKAGKYYVNVHTNANKGGEIRGQIVPKS